jgi:hypothetical protein
LIDDGRDSIVEDLILRRVLVVHAVEMELARLSTLVFENQGIGFSINLHTAVIGCFLKR